jgi:uncharacterized protein YbaA (DUF1428 family)
MRLPRMKLIRCEEENPMGRYIDGFVLAVPKKRLAEYKKLATRAGKVWRKCGALEYYECVGEDLEPKWGMPFMKTVKARPGETIIFSWIVYKSRAHRDKVNAKVMRDPMMTGDPKDMPFDMKRMAYGGFEVLVKA